MLSQGDRHRWLHVSPDTLGDVLADIAPAIAQKLGGPPRTCIVIEMSDTPGSGRLAVAFALAFARRWPAVACDVRDRIYALPDLQRALRDGLSLDLPG